MKTKQMLLMAGAAAFSAIMLVGDTGARGRSPTADHQGCLRRRTHPAGSALWKSLDLTTSIVRGRMQMTWFQVTAQRGARRSDAG